MMTLSELKRLRALILWARGTAMMRRETLIEGESTDMLELVDREIKLKELDPRK